MIGSNGFYTMLHLVHLSSIKVTEVNGMECKIMKIFGLLDEVIEEKRHGIMNDGVIKILEDAKEYLKKNVCVCPSGIKNKCFPDHD